MTSPAQDGARPPGLSLERRLPLLMTALLLATMAAGLASAYVEVKRTALDTALERLEAVSGQLATTVATSIGLRVAALDEVGRDPAVLDFLAAHSGASRPAAEAALARLRVPQQQALATELWSPARAPLLRLGAAAAP
ncbi:MAG: hypothetical protein AB1941_11615, partial [Gemmatimonadota bacterium]